MALPEISPRPAVAAEPVPLASLPEHTRAVVTAVDHEDAVTERLLDLGLTPGTTVEVMRRAPLGDPILYGFRGIQLALRSAEARRILVRPLRGPAAA